MLFNERPLFNLEPFALKDIYVDTECTVHSWKQIKDGEVSPFKEKSGERLDLLNEVLDRIKEEKFKEAIVIQGAAGSGKSSFTLRLATRLIEEDFTPVRIQLKRVSSKDSLFEVLEKALEFDDDDKSERSHIERKGILLDGRVFDQRYGNTNLCRYVLILDGWDEVRLGASESLRDKAARVLNAVRDELLSNRALRVRIILTGRPSADIYEDSFRFLNDDTPIFTIRPFKPSQLNEFIERLHKATNNQTLPAVGGVQWHVPSPRKLEPLLERYESTFNQARIAAPEAVMDMLGYPQLAYAALRVVSQISDGSANGLRPEKAGHESPLSRLLISFYFKDEPLDQGCEFLHRAFCDYLVAEAIVALLKQFSSTPPARRRNKKRDFDLLDHEHSYQFSRSVVKILAPAWLSREVLTHLEYLIEWEIQRSKQNEGDGQSDNAPKKVSFEQWENIRDGLASLWEWWVDEAHLRPQLNRVNRADDSGDVSKDPSLAYEALTEWMAPISPSNQVPGPFESTTALDAHLGDAIFRLCSLVHYHLAVADGWGVDCDGSLRQLSPEELWDGATAPGAAGRADHYYQTRITRGGKSWILFSPHNGSRRDDAAYDRGANDEERRDIDIEGIMNGKNVNRLNS